MTHTRNQKSETIGTESQMNAAAADLPNALCPMADLATAGQPRSEHFRKLARAGFKMVIDLRHPTEPRGFDEAAVVREAGLRYENIPVAAPALGDAEFDRLRAVLTDAANRPALVHCGSANRVGALLIPYFVLDEGRTTDEALRLAQQVGLQSQELADIALEYTEQRTASDSSR